MITPGQVRIVLIGDHRIDAVIDAYDSGTGSLTKRLAAYAIRDQYGWAFMRHRVTRKYRTVARLDGLPDSRARGVVAHRLVELATA